MGREDLAGFLKAHPKCRGKRIAELARMLSLEHSTASRIMSGTSLPSLENMLRIAVVLGEHPATLYELAGMQEAATLLRTLFPQEIGHPLEYRLTQLLEQGFENAVAGCFAAIESASKVRS